MITQMNDICKMSILKSNDNFYLYLNHLPICKANVLRKHQSFETLLYHPLSDVSDLSNLGRRPEPVEIKASAVMSILKASGR